MQTTRAPHASAADVQPPPPAPVDPAHTPENDPDAPNPGDPGPPVPSPSQPRLDDPLCDPRLPTIEPPPRGI
ncbi:hypothetical protein [Sandaracinus amylolyticus]|uniref:hypothetical protein n=1 Tax=Sandaracinus amylolyticus TaxID=927083 RepID=UPI001F2E9953|nr:hypothetical protein [Sandaracinus amylolyticus]UJR80001.1 Hypothetical protein I5071_20440 [Sandaracinus amylolyticus]